MSLLANKCKIQVIDINGKYCDQSFYVPGSVVDPAAAGVTAIVDAVDAMIEGGTVQNQLEFVDAVQVGGTGGGTQDWNCADKIHCVCRSTTDGSTAIIDLPAPGTLSASGAAIFTASGGLNMTNSNVLALIDFINDSCLDTNGNQLVFVSGSRTRSSRLKTSFV